MIEKEVVQLMRWTTSLLLKDSKRATLQHNKIVYFELFLGSRRAKNRSILGVCEDFEVERNAKRAKVYGFLLY